ncbi:Tetratricopeptide repeat superfamily protein [Perilla frutescens var. hirtella]|uniref:Tetratricopeptide repeat superfamily protein n=1 Tax=Perilla frutescens var. hirtella TaxID=608512 RepID=A0AAD4IRT3_PERFH|nr:Tetratricopeptide repeat superfamily protein [Perilla frutescens var. hirtella]
MRDNYFDAKKLFWQLQLRYASPWNWMIRGFTRMGCYDYGILFYFKMLSFGTSPDKYTFPYLIKACGGVRAVDLVKYLHGMMHDLGFELDVYVGSALVSFYAENDCLDNAREVFDKLPQRDVVLWNGMLNGYLKCEGMEGNLIELFEQMRRSEVEPNAVTYTCVLKLCGSKSMMKLGTLVHGLVMRCGLEMVPSVANTLVALYAKCRCLSDARKLFDSVVQADLVTWNSMIGGYVQNGFMNEALDLFRRLMYSDVKPDSVTFASLLPLVPELGNLNLGKQIHCYIVRNGVCLDLFLKNALIDVYFKCRDVDMACKVFEQSSDVDIVICTAMISGLVLNGMNPDALEIFRWLVGKKMRPNAVTFASTLPACAGLTALTLGKELHGNIIRRGLEGRCYIGSALTDMYAKCGRLDLGQQVFLRMPERDSVCWNSIITSCSQNGKPEAAMDIFRDMGLEGAKYDCVSISAALSACASLPSLRHGKELHGFMMRGGFNSDLFASSALIDMYAKCGHLDLAQRVFDSMETRNEVSWNSIIAAYGNHGHLHQCLALFNAMEDEGFQPDHVTFLAIMSACGHAGEVEEGKRHFNSMIQEYGIAARMEHYSCLIDMLGRAGRLGEAFQVIEAMPFSPEAGIWGTLLGSCRIHGNVELAEVASRHLFRLDPQNSGYYVLLSNLHADSGTWGRVDEIRNMMKERGVQKIPGFSWIEVNNSNHVFAAADKNHPQASQIYQLLNDLLVELQDEGYVARFSH